MQHYFSYIVEVIVNGGGNRSTSRKQHNSKKICYAKYYPSTYLSIGLENNSAQWLCVHWKINMNIIWGKQCKVKSKTKQSKNRRSDTNYHTDHMWYHMLRKGKYFLVNWWYRRIYRIEGKTRTSCICWKFYFIFSTIDLWLYNKLNHLIYKANM